MLSLVLPLLALAAPAPAATPSDSLSHYYLHLEPARIAVLLERAHTREQLLLCRYRLYPLTRDRALVADIPPAAEARTAREAALIAAMWAFRIHASPPWTLPTYGRRSEAALDRARALDAEDPYVLLVEGQALLYKPAMFGGDPRAALRTFERLRATLARRPAPGMDPLEADIWVWMAMRRLEMPGAEALRRRLLAGAPPPLIRQFLTAPPD